MGFVRGYGDHMYLDGERDQNPVHEGELVQAEQRHDGAQVVAQGLAKVLHIVPDCGVQQCKLRYQRHMELELTK
jgi:hypothetical protein